MYRPSAYMDYNQCWSGENYDQGYQAHPYGALLPPPPPPPAPYHQDYQAGSSRVESQYSTTRSNSSWKYGEERSSHSQYLHNEYDSSDSQKNCQNSSQYKRKPSYYNSYEEEDPQNDDQGNTSGCNSDLLNEDSYEYTSPLMSLDAKRKDTQKVTKGSSALPSNKRPPPVKMDPSTPAEIVALIKTNSCDLCSVKLNSRIQARTHYEGKPHAKKLKSAIDEFNEKIEAAKSPTEKSKTDAPTAAPPPAKKRKTTTTDGSKLYCKCCDLSFTSTDHATQHYLGRNHHRVLHGLKPLKAGYYNKDTGKWQRMPPDPRTPTERLIAADSSEDPNDPDSVKDKGKFFCELCGVSATSQDQLDGHLKGIRHKKTATAAKKKNQPVGL